MPGIAIEPLVVACTLLAGALAMVAALAASARRQPEPVRAAQLAWARGLAGLPLGWVLLEASVALDTHALAVPAKMLFMAAFVEFLGAMRRLDGDPIDRRWFWIPVLAVGLLSVGFAAAFPSDPMRTGLLNLLCAAAALSTAQSALAHLRNGGSPQAAVLVAAFAGVAVILIGRATLLYLPADAPARLWAESPLAQSLLLGSSVLGPAVATLAFALMGADRLLDRLERIASRDSLTGAASRHAFLEAANASLARARQRGEPLSVVVVDLDHFKSVNDAFGHAGGDTALKRVASALGQALREQDLLGRLGGEEFAALLPGADVATARQVAERLREAVAAAVLEINGQRVPLRLSAGVACLRPGDRDLGGLLDRADRGLYQAKRAGRDQVACTP